MINIQEILKAEDLTIYGACKLISSKTGEDIKTLHLRLTCWAKNEPRQFKDLEVLLDALGYQIEIFKKIP